jgi:hypothetical protein
MTKLGDALRRKYKSPQEAIIALGLDASIINEQLKENTHMTSLVALARRPTVVSALKAFTQGRLAMDADMEDVHELLDKLEDVIDHVDDMGEEDDDDTQGEDAAFKKRAADAKARLGRDETDEERTEREKKDKAEDARMRLGRDESEAEKTAREKREDDDKKAEDSYKRARDAFKAAHDAKMSRDARRRLGRDETPEEKAERMKKFTESKDAKDAVADPKAPESVTKEAMDSALVVHGRKVAADVTKSIRDNERAIREAERAVRPWVGEMSIAFDSAEGVYRTALENLGVKEFATIHQSALRSVLEYLPKPAHGATHAHDSALPAGIKPAEERFTNVSRIRA